MERSLTRGQTLKFLTLFSYGKEKTTHREITLTTVPYLSFEGSARKVWLLDSQKQLCGLDQKEPRELFLPSRGPYVS